MGPGHGADAQTFAAAYSGTGGGGQASGTFNVSWRQGQSVEYGGAFYLPANFHLAMTGQQALLRWGSSPAADGSVEQGGVVIDYSDNAGYLVAATVTNGSTAQQTMAGPFPLPIGTWFTLQVRQLLGSGAAAYSDVYLNGRLFAASRASIFSGTQIDHVRYGIVQLTPDAAQGPVSLDFDQVTAAGYTGYIDPLGGDRYITGRTDMGVDFCLAPASRCARWGAGSWWAWPDWFRHQPYLWYQLHDGPYAGRYAYIAEQVTGLRVSGRSSVPVSPWPTTRSQARVSRPVGAPPTAPPSLTPPPATPKGRSPGPASPSPTSSALSASRDPSSSLRPRYDGPGVDLQIR